MVVCEKYRSQTKYQENMKVAVLMNRMPSMTQLSRDRYRILDLGGATRQKIQTVMEEHLPMKRPAAPPSPTPSVASVASDFSICNKAVKLDLTDGVKRRPSSQTSIAAKFTEEVGEFARKH